MAIFSAPRTPHADGMELMQLARASHAASIAIGKLDDKVAAVVSAALVQTNIIELFSPLLSGSLLLVNCSWRDARS
jgi:hypothetical protein